MTKNAKSESLYRTEFVLGLRQAPWVQGTLFLHSVPTKKKLPCCNDFIDFFTIKSVDSRLFAGGTSEDGESCIVELSLTERPKIKHAYDGLVSTARDYVYYDIVNGKYLAAIDEFKIKFWEMGNTKLLKTLNARIGEVVIKSKPFEQRQDFI